MRLFFAVEFDDALKDAVSKAIGGIRIANPPWRWVARPNIHITLKFLGDMDDEFVPLLADAVSALCRETRPFELVLGGLGGFPNLKKPRVLFYEATRGAPELTSLARRIDATLHSELAIAKEDRPFRAHATVARIKTPIPADLAARLERAPGVESYTQRVEKVSLMQSELHRDGAIYSLVKGIALVSAG
jgi:2'-5' RNA ligase